MAKALSVIVVTSRWHHAARGTREGVALSHKSGRFDILWRLLPFLVLAAACGDYPTKSEHDELVARIDSLSRSHAESTAELQSGIDSLAILFDGAPELDLSTRYDTLRYDLFWFDSTYSDTLRAYVQWRFTGTHARGVTGTFTTRWVNESDNEIVVRPGAVAGHDTAGAELARDDGVIGGFDLQPGAEEDRWRGSFLFEVSTEVAAQISHLGFWILVL